MVLSLTVVYSGHCYWALASVNKLCDIFSGQHLRQSEAIRSSGWYAVRRRCNLRQHGYVNITCTCMKKIICRIQIQTCPVVVEHGWSCYRNRIPQYEIRRGTGNFTRTRVTQKSPMRFWEMARDLSTAMGSRPRNSLLYKSRLFGRFHFPKLKRQLKKTDSLQQAFDWL